MIEMIHFWVFFWFFQFPWWVIFCCKHEKVHDVLNGKDEDEDDD